MRIVVVITNNEKAGSHKHENKDLTIPVTHISHILVKLSQSHLVIILFKIPPILQ